MAEARDVAHEEAAEQREVVKEHEKRPQQQRNKDKMDALVDGVLMIGAVECERVGEITILPHRPCHRANERHEEDVHAQPAHTAGCHAGRELSWGARGSAARLFTASRRPLQEQ